MKKQPTRSTSASHAAKKTPRKPPISTDPNWEEFKSLHPNHPALKADTIYALPPSFIDQIVKEAPGLLSGSELQFEYDLARLSGGSFFLGNATPIIGPLAQKFAIDEANQEQASRIKQSRKRIEELMNEEMRESGRHPREIEAHRKRHQKMSQEIELRRWGYAGWLVTNSEFRQNSNEFRSQWRDVIRRNGQIPRVPQSLFGERPETIKKSQRPFYDDYMFFYRKWGLESLRTWELPVPLVPERHSTSVYHLPSVQEAGLMLFLPWYLSRDKDIKARELIEHQLKYFDQPHLKDWLENRPKGWGYERYGLMLTLYILLELALKVRYSQLLNRKTDAIDHVISFFLRENSSASDTAHEGVDSIKKARQEMNRRLKNAAVD